MTNGKLLTGNFSEFVPTFWKEDPLSPFRISAIFKLLRSQIIYNTLSGLLDSAMEKFVPNITISEAANELQEQIRNFKADNGSVGISVWAYPTIQGNAFGRRSIVFGQYQGSSAPIQLVDQVGFRFKAGLLGVLALPVNYVRLSALFNTSLQRSWTHVRSMPDLTTATQQKVSKIIVPSLMKKLGKVIGGTTQCSLTMPAWFSEEIITTFRTWVIYFDKDRIDGKDYALKLREQLIQQGVETDKIIFTPVSKAVLCEKEINDKINKNVEDFLKEFALDETITISDSLVLNSGVGLDVDISYIDKLKAGITYERSAKWVRPDQCRSTASALVRPYLLDFEVFFLGGFDCCFNFLFRFVATSLGR